MASRCSFCKSASFSRLIGNLFPKCHCFCMRIRQTLASSHLICQRLVSFFLCCSRQRMVNAMLFSCIIKFFFSSMPRSLRFIVLVVTLTHFIVIVALGLDVFRCSCFLFLCFFSVSLSFRCCRFFSFCSQLG